MDVIIEKLLHFDEKKRVSEILKEDEIIYFISEATQIFLQESSLLQLEAPIKICGTESKFLPGHSHYSR